MKKHLSFMSICLALPISVFSQKFVSDSVCYENTISGAKIRCEIPSLAPESDMYFTNLWEIERNGDFIKIVNWYRKPIDETYVNSNGDTMLTVGTGSTTHFNIAYRDQEEVTYVTNKIRQSSQIFQGRASNGISVEPSTISWRLFDLNDDGIWDRLILGWLENGPIMRVIYCHKE